MKDKNISISLRELMEYVMAFLLMLSCNSVYQRTTRNGSYLNYIEYAVLAVAFLLVVTQIVRKSSVKKKAIAVIFSLFAVCAIYLVVTNKTTERASFIFLFLIFIPCMLFYLSCLKAENLTEIYRKFSDVVLVVSLVSTVVWICVQFLHIFSPNMQVEILWGNAHTVNGYFGLFFETQKEATFGLNDFLRNTGIYCEAPMHSLVLSLSLGYEMFFRSRLSKLRITLLVILILTTVSSTGIICIAVCFILKYIKNGMRGRSGFSLFSFIGLIILGIGGALLFNFIFESKSDTASYSVRTIDYIASFRLWLKNPIFGSGFGNLTPLYEFKEPLLVDAGFNTDKIGLSNSLAAVMGQGGIVMLVVYFLPFVVIFTKKQKELSAYKYWSVLIIYLFATTIFQSRYIMMYFLALAYIVAFEVGDVRKYRVSMLKSK